MATKAKPANTVMTASGPVTIDAEATYRVTLAFAVRYLGQWLRPSDRNVQVRGDALLIIAETARDGAIIDATQI
jgi:hypothetical protein